MMFHKVYHEVASVSRYYGYNPIMCSLAMNINTLPCNHIHSLTGALVPYPMLVAQLIGRELQSKTCRKPIHHSIVTHRMLTGVLKKDKANVMLQS